MSNLESFVHPCLLTCSKHHFLALPGLQESELQSALSIPSNITIATYPALPEAIDGDGTAFSVLKARPPTDAETFNLLCMLVKIA